MTMTTVRGRMKRRRQEDEETTTTGVATTKVCHCVCDYHHYSPEEEERLTMTTIIGEKALGEGCHYDTMTRKTAMVTTVQDAGSTTGEVIRHENNGIFGLHHQTD